jgi:hypothetical protein
MRMHAKGAKCAWYVFVLIIEEQGAERVDIIRLKHDVDALCACVHCYERTTRCVDKLIAGATKKDDKGE